MFASTQAPRRLVMALLCCGTAAATASPLTIDFESAPPLTIIGPSQPDLYYEEGGVRFTPGGNDAMVDLSFCAVGAESCITSNNSVYLTALNGADITITRGDSFSLTGLDAAFFPAPTPVGRFAGLSMGLQLVGTQADGSTLTQTLALLEDPNSAGDFLFSAYGLNGATLRSLTLSACFITGNECVRSGGAFDDAGLGLNDMAFAIDNLRFAQQIPEPAAGWLVALGLAAVAASRRRKVA